MIAESTKALIPYINGTPFSAPIYDQVHQDIHIMDLIARSMRSGTIADKTNGYQDTHFIDRLKRASI